MAFGLLWIPATIAASLLQTARNLAQRSLTETIGVVGAVVFVGVVSILLSLVNWGVSLIFSGLRGEMFHDKHRNALRRVHEAIAEGLRRAAEA